MGKALTRAELARSTRARPVTSRWGRSTSSRNPPRCQPWALLLPLASPSVPALAMYRHPSPALARGPPRPSSSAAAPQSRSSLGSSPLVPGSGPLALSARASRAARPLLAPHQRRRPLRAAPVLAGLPFIRSTRVSRPEGALGTAPLTKPWGGGRGLPSGLEGPGPPLEGPGEFLIPSSESDVPSVSGGPS